MGLGVLGLTESMHMHVWCFIVNLWLPKGHKDLTLVKVGGSTASIARIGGCKNIWYWFCFMAVACWTIVTYLENYVLRLSWSCWSWWGFIYRISLATEHWGMMGTNCLGFKCISLVVVILVDVPKNLHVGNRQYWVVCPTTLFSKPAKLAWMSFLVVDW